MAPDKADTLVREAQAACRQGRFADGVALARSAIATDPARARAHLLLGMALMQLGEATAALASFDAAIAREPGLADAHGNRGDALAALGRAVDAVASYDRAVALAPEAIENWLNRAAALLDLGRADEAVESYDRALAQAPDLAEAHFTRGIALRYRERDQEALAAFERTLEIDPSHFGAAINRGSVLFKRDRFEAALASFSMALAVRPNDVDALYNVAFTLGALHRHAEALATYERLLAIQPDHLDALLNHGTELQALHRAEEALASYAKIVALKPEHVEAHLNEAFARLALGDFRGGFATFEWRLRKPGFEARNFAQPAWRGREPAAGRTLFLYAEQGLGDTINMVRYVPLLAREGVHVVLEVPPSLKTMLAPVEGATAVLARGDPLPGFDLHTPLMSLPLAFGTEPATIPAEVPYLTAPPERVAEWAARLPPAGRPRVGVNWFGNPAFPEDRKRSMTLPDFVPVLATPGIDFVSLNPGLRGEDLDRLAAMGSVTHLASEFRDFADTAAVIAGLDLVITTDTAIAHLAGALGRPLWLMVSWAPDWRWVGEGETTPWYPSARLFRQVSAGDWTVPLAGVRRELAALAATGWPGPARP